MKANIIKNSLSESLIDYIRIREKEKNESKSELHRFLIFSSGFTATQKIQAAQKLLNAIDTPNTTFTHDEYKILTNGRLGSIVENFSKSQKLPNNLQKMLISDRIAQLISLTY